MLVNRMAMVPTVVSFQSAVNQDLGTKSVDYLANQGLIAVAGTHLKHAVNSSRRLNPYIYSM